ncbi:MAG: Fe-S cluster assembly ATPase SufC [Candidatus Pacearchaeota archaeon]
MLEIKDLHVAIDGTEILKGVNLRLEKGKIHALMGPNGSGKSTLANAIMGHPSYEITKGQILFNGEDITELEADERAKRGLFLSFQYPKEIEGVTISNFLKNALNNLREEKISVLDYKKLLNEKLELLDMKQDFAERYLNSGFSGGEKKKSEILQLAVMNPACAILDETDSGLDIDALKTVAHGVNKIADENKEFLIITHYKRILEHVKPDKISIMIDGKIATEGGPELADQLEEQGYKWIEQE